MNNSAINSGRRAFKEGRPITDNPCLYGPNVALSAWWEAGWQQAKQEAEEKADKEIT